MWPFGPLVALRSAVMGSSESVASSSGRYHTKRGARPPPLLVLAVKRLLAPLNEGSRLGV